jgi:hypothetical protein
MEEYNTINISKTKPSRCRSKKWRFSKSRVILITQYSLPVMQHLNVD